MNNILFKVWFGSILSLLGTLLPTWTLQEKQVFLKPVPAQVVKASPAVAPKLVLAHQPKAAPAIRTEYRCTFLGTATYQGRPYENAKLVFWLTTPNGHQVYQLQTASDGSYSLSVSVEANPNDPIDWEIRGQTADLKVVNLAGRQIAMLDHSLVAIEASLAFAND